MCRPILVSLVAVTLLVPGTFAASKPSPPSIVDLDRIVAVVNNDVITASELELRLTETKQQLTAQRIQLPAEDVLRRQLLERMIVEQIQLQLAVQSGVRVTDDDVEKAIKAIASRNRLTVDSVYDAVKQQGIDRASYREQVRNQVTIQQLVEREIYSRTAVSDSEIDAFLENSRTQQDTEYDLSHIFLAIPESAAPEQIQAVKARADDVRQQIARGEDFARAAVTHSQGPDALKGGTIGWKSAGQLPELFVTALNQLKPNEVSEVLKGPNGFHILKLNDRRGGGGGEAVQQTHVRHILLKPSEIVSRNDARANLRRLRERIAQGEDFATLARSHSEDPVSASQGGDLGWIAPGQTVPEFERAMQALAPGTLSEPVESSFGVHLIEVLERRQAVSGDRVRMTARNQIHARKADDRYEQWLRRLRDEAYVEYLLDLDE